MARGRIEALDVSAGDRVAAGQRLAVLDNFDLSAAHSKVVSTEAGLNQAKAQLATADAAYVRATNLFHGNAVPQKDVETTRAAAASMEAEVRTKEAELRQYQQEEARLLPVHRAVTGTDSSTSQASLDSRGAIVAPYQSGRKRPGPDHERTRGRDTGRLKAALMHSTIPDQG